MVKKISAIILALVLCLSVVVLPVSAAGFADDYALPDGAQMAFRIELDKEYYSAGDMATVSIYFVGDESLEFGAGAISIGVNTAVFNATDNTTTTIKQSATSSDAYNSFYKPAKSSTWSFLTSTTNTNFKKIANNSTAEENAMYNAYVKLVIARDLNNSTHENGQSNMNGIYGYDLSSASEPIVTFKLKVASGVADGTVINVGIPSGSYTTAAKQTYMNYYSDPGNATTTTTLVDSLVDMSDCKLTATIGAPALAIEKEKQQIKFGVTDGEYNNTFAARTFVKFTNFSEVFDDAADALDTADGDGLLEVGFVYKVGAFDETTAKNYIADAEFGDVIGTEKSVDGYTIDRHAYVSTSVVENGYAMGATINNIPAADKTTNITVLAYAKYTTGGDPVYAYCPVSGTFETLYNTYYGQAFPG